jgi:hypothetical protein
LYFVAILLLFHLPLQHVVDIRAPKLLPLGVEVGSACLLLGLDELLVRWVADEAKAPSL